ncbi:DegV family protein [Peptoniphilus catoniae]|uniref:DegV family protein n=1 Tax=Peptoniphilus catoniae TaxID=1660341 RepID=UPI0010FCE12A|nr:DegV family protein [Peptoniphilus catoniae]
MSIKIVTDTGMDLTSELIEKYDIEVLNILINDGEEEYSKGEINSDKLFEDMKAGKVYRTSQVSSFDYRNCFEKYAKEKRELISISLSSGLSGSYEQSVKIKEEVLQKYPDAKIHTVDSRSATYGQGLVVVKAAKMAKDGKDAAYILDNVEKIKTGVKHIFSVNDLSYLVRGGRVSKGAAAIGSLLNIRPLMEIDPNGKLVPREKVRGDKNLLKKITDKYLETYEKTAGDQSVFIAYGDDDSFARKIKDTIVEKSSADPKTIILGQVGVVIGAHTGPGFIGLFYVDEIFNEGFDLV